MVVSSMAVLCIDQCQRCRGRGVIFGAISSYEVKQASYFSRVTVELTRYEAVASTSLDPCIHVQDCRHRLGEWQLPQESGADDDGTGFCLYDHWPQAMALMLTGISFILLRLHTSSERRNHCQCTVRSVKSIQKEHCSPRRGKVSYCTILVWNHLLSSGRSRSMVQSKEVVVAVTRRHANAHHTCTHLIPVTPSLSR